MYLHTDYTLRVAGTPEGKERPVTVDPRRILAQVRDVRTGGGLLGAPDTRSLPTDVLQWCLGICRQLLEYRLGDLRLACRRPRLDADRVTLPGGAELAGTNVWEFAALAEREGVTWVSDEHLAADLRDL